MHAHAKSGECEDDEQHLTCPDDIECLGSGAAQGDGSAERNDEPGNEGRAVAGVVLVRSTARHAHPGDERPEERTGLGRSGPPTGSASSSPNRKLNDAMHLIPVTQIGHAGTRGRAFYDRKLADGKTPNDAVRCEHVGRPRPR